MCKCISACICACACASFWEFLGIVKDNYLNVTVETDRKTAGDAASSAGVSAEVVFCLIMMSRKQLFPYEKDMIADGIETLCTEQWDHHVEGKLNKGFFRQNYMCIWPSCIYSNAFI